MKRVGILLLALLFALTGCSGSWGSQAPPEAGEGSPVPEEISSAPVLEGESQGDSKEFSWEIGEPQRHGMNPQVLSRMHEALEESQVCFASERILRFSHAVVQRAVCLFPEKGHRSPASQVPMNPVSHVPCGKTAKQGLPP